MKGKKTGGRTKGSKNKMPAVKKEYIASLLGDYFESDLMHQDFLALEVRDRIMVAEKLMKYVIPAMQATAMDLNLSQESHTLEERLSQLATPGSTE